ncbi:hypothetical protein ACFWOX_03915 [Streptomyces sp. NPDC058467]|uniref:hypothetical protein n=1 Tax=Streptomyces sp. NPDC058467 TaxID=3346513 RepID=UPI003646ACA4
MGSFYGNVLVARAYEEVVPLLAAAAEVERAAGVMGECPSPSAPTPTSMGDLPHGTSADELALLGGAVRPAGSPTHEEETPC